MGFFEKESTVSTAVPSSWSWCLRRCASTIKTVLDRVAWWHVLMYITYSVILTFHIQSLPLMVFLTYNKLIAWQVINGFMSDWHTQVLPLGPLPCCRWWGLLAKFYDSLRISIKPCLPGHCQICFNGRQLFFLPSGYRALHSGELDHTCSVICLYFSLKNSTTTY